MPFDRQKPRYNLISRHSSWWSQHRSQREIAGTQQDHLVQKQMANVFISIDFLYAVVINFIRIVYERSRDGAGPSGTKTDGNHFHLDRFLMCGGQSHQEIPENHLVKIEGTERCVLPFWKSFQPSQTAYGTQGQYRAIWYEEKACTWDRNGARSICEQGHCRPDGTDKEFARTVLKDALEKSDEGPSILTMTEQLRKAHTEWQTHQLRQTNNVFRIWLRRSSIFQIQI